MHIPLINNKKKSPTKPTKKVPSINTNLQPPPKFESSSNFNSNSDTDDSNSPAGSRRLSFGNSPIPTSPRSLSSNHRRQVSDRIKSTPSSMVRHSRVYSQDFDTNNLIKTNSFNSVQSSNLVPSKNVNSFSNFLSENSDLPPELMPIIKLFNCFNYRIFNLGSFHILNANREWVMVEAKLAGNELSIWYPEDFNPKYYNLFDYTVTYDYKNYTIRFSNNIDNSSNFALVIRLGNDAQFKNWLNSIVLSDIEKISLNKAFTAVILSLIGPKLSDIHILLSKKKYPKFEYYNIRFPQINDKWLKCYVGIYPSTPKKLGKIEIYLNDKVSRKNMIAYIRTVDEIYNVFPENINMIEFNSLMKAHGEIYVNRNYESFFTELKSAGHNRTSSQLSFFSQHSNSSPPSSPKIKTSQHFMRTDYIYLMPKSHPGVSEIETMIRNFIPILDAFKLYGRPQQLISNKSSKESLLFGLPSLPHYQYLSINESLGIVEKFLLKSVNESWGIFDWYEEFKTHLANKMAKENYKGDGSISQLYKSLELDEAELESVRSSPGVNMPQTTLSPSPLPMENHSPMENSPIDPDPQSPFTNDYMLKNSPPPPMSQSPERNGIDHRVNGLPLQQAPHIHYSEMMLTPNGVGQHNPEPDSDSEPQQVGGQFVRSISGTLDPSSIGNQQPHPYRSKA